MTQLNKGTHGLNTVYNFCLVVRDFKKAIKIYAHVSWYTTLWC